MNDGLEFGNGHLNIPEGCDRACGFWPVSVGHSGTKHPP